MNRFLRIAISTAAVLAGLYVATATIVPRIVSADAWRDRIEERLSTIAGRPVALGRLRLSLWTGIAVRADRLAVGGTPSIEAASVSVGLAWGPLLRREVRPRWIAAEGTSIRRGSVTFVEGASLRARIGRERDGTTRVVGRVQGRVVALREAPAGQVDFEALASGDRLELRSFVGRVGAHVMEARAVIEGIRGAVQRAEVSGTARVAGVTLMRLEADLVVGDGLARLDRASFQLHGGTGSARGVAQVADAGVPFHLEASVENVSVESLASESFPSAGAPIDGRLSARIDLEGRADAPSPLTLLDGEARLEIVQGTLRSVGLVKQAARLLEMAGGRGLGKDVTPFDSIAATFAVRGGGAETSDLRFRSADLDLDGGGEVGLDGALDLDVVAGFSRQASGELTGRTPQLRFRMGPDGRLTIPMKIRGSIASPAVQIDLDRVLKEGLQKELRERGKSGWLKKLIGRS